MSATKKALAVPANPLVQDTNNETLSCVRSVIEFLRNAQLEDGLNGRELLDVHDGYQLILGACVDAIQYEIDRS